MNSRLVELLTGPHGADRYTELVTPTWSSQDARARVVAVQRRTPRSVTLWLKPNQAARQQWAGFRAGQHVTLAIEIDGRRYTRCYSPANAEGAPLIELTISRHDGGLASTFLVEKAECGMVVGIESVGGDFVLPSQRPRRILLVSGGSGITPVMSMLRTLRAERFDGDIAFIHYARCASEAVYRDELAAAAAESNVTVLHGFTRSSDGHLQGRFSPEHLATAMPSPEAVFVCGPPTLADAVRELCGNVRSESFVPPVFTVPAQASGGRITFDDSGIERTDDGRSLLEQAEAAGLKPANGCRMGICHTCTRRKTRGAVRNLVTGSVSTGDEEDVQICVSAPVGDVAISI